MLKQPGYGQIKRADTPINLSVSPRSNWILLNKNKPSAFESEIYPSQGLPYQTPAAYDTGLSPLPQRQPQP